MTVAALAACICTMAQDKTHYEVRWSNHPADAKTYDTQRLRKEFLIERVFAPGEVCWTYSMYDRFLIGGAMPTTEPLKLAAIEPLKARTLLENREIGIINIGGPGTVTVDGRTYDMGMMEGLYVGRATDKHPN